MQIQVAPNNHNKTPENAGVTAGIIQENKNKVQLVFIEAIHRKVNGLSRKQMKGNKVSRKRETTDLVLQKNRHTTVPVFSQFFSKSLQGLKWNSTLVCIWLNRFSLKFHSVL